MTIEAGRESVSATPVTTVPISRNSEVWFVRARRVLPSILAFILLLLCWHFAISIYRVPAALFPSPMAVLIVFRDAWDVLFRNTIPTLVEAVFGLGAGILVGLPLGVALARRNWFSQALFPLILGTQMIPKVAIAPLLVVWLGFGATPKYTLVFLVTFFPIVITTVAGIQSVPREMHELAAVAKMSTLRKLWSVELPYALPSILSGVKVAVTFSLIAAIVAEFVSANEGLGSLITNAQASVNTPLIFAAIIVVSLLGFVLYGIVAVAEIMLIPWHISQRSKEGTH